MLSDLGIFQASTFIRKLRKLPGSVRAAFCNDYLVGVGIHYQVRVVRDDYDLSPTLGRFETLDEFVVD